MSYLDGAFKSMREERAHIICAGMRSWWMVEKVWPQKELISDFRVGSGLVRQLMVLVLLSLALPADAASLRRPGCRSRSLRSCPLRASWIQSSQLPNADVILPRHCGGEQLRLL